MLSFPSAGRPIRIDEYEPSGSGPLPAILLLHGSGGNVSFWLDRLAPQLNRLGIALYAAHYFDRTGTTRADAATILDGYHFPLWLATVSDAIAHIVSRPRIDPARLSLLGISLGAFLALALAATDAQAARSIRAIVAISGGLPEPYAGQATGRFPPTLILHGETDTVVPVSHARSLDTLLTSLNAPHRLRTFPNEGHWFSSLAQMQMLLAVSEFLGAQLQPASKPA